jgi:hypothetical protein
MTRKTKNKYSLKSMFETYLNKKRYLKLRETMAPYQPPNAHYSQMDVSDYTEDQIFSFIGKTGKKFYWLTHKLGLDYLWYDKERKIIEIWGPLYTHLNQQSAHVIRCELDFFLKPKLEKNISKNQDVQTPIEAC